MKYRPAPQVLPAGVDPFAGLDDMQFAQAPQPQPMMRQRMPMRFGMRPMGGDAYGMMRPRKKPGQEQPQIFRPPWPPQT